MFCSSFDLCSVHGVRFYFCNTFGTVTSEIWIFGSDYLSNRIINAIQYKVCAFDTKIIGLVILKQNIPYVSSQVSLHLRCNFEDIADTII